MRGLPFYVKREAFARADTRQRVAYILSAVLVITMLCVIFRFSAADATHSSHLSEGVCIRLVRELNSVFPEQFPKEKLVKVAEAIEYPIRKCAHFTEYAVLGITVNLYLWMCYRMEMLLSRKKKAKDIQRTEEKLQKTVRQKAVVQENVLPEIRNIKEKVTAQESATQETEIARQTVENTEQKMELSIWSFIIRAEIAPYMPAVMSFISTLCREEAASSLMSVWTVPAHFSVHCCSGEFFICENKKENEKDRKFLKRVKVDAFLENSYNKKT